jgi:tRNA pseudouridine38-40 synthase
MPRYKLTVAYDGTNFHGWQKQHPQDAEPLRTVQGVLEKAVSEVVREEVSLVGASRTDAGVHARGQVAAFTCAKAPPHDRLPAAITARLPADVQVRSACEVPDDFSPITDCLTKGYSYRLAFGRRSAPLFGRFYTAWTPYRLDVESMNEGARQLIGTHDFTSFTRVNHGRESTVRTVHDCRVISRKGRRCRMDIVGDGFLYNMVRIIAGTLVEVGRGRIAPDDIPGIIEARDRSAAGATMPASGLCLVWIKYDVPQAAREQSNSGSVEQ